MAIWRKFIPWDAPTGARQYNNACPHHLLNVCDINENWTNLCRSLCIILPDFTICAAIFQSDWLMSCLIVTHCDVTGLWGRAGEDSSQHCDSSPLSSATVAPLYLMLFIRFCCCAPTEVQAAAAAAVLCVYGWVLCNVLSLAGVGVVCKCTHCYSNSFQHRLLIH